MIASAVVASTSQTSSALAVQGSGRPRLLVEIL